MMINPLEAYGTHNTIEKVKSIFLVLCKLLIFLPVDLEEIY